MVGKQGEPDARQIVPRDSRRPGGLKKRGKKEYRGGKKLGRQGLLRKRGTGLDSVVDIAQLLEKRPCHRKNTIKKKMRK